MARQIQVTGKVLREAVGEKTPGYPLPRTSDLSGTDLFRKVKKRFWDILSAMPREGQPFIVRPEFREIYSGMVYWAFCCPDGLYNPKKGFWLLGNVGTGKSTLIKALKQLCMIVRPNSKVTPRPPYWSSWLEKTAKEITSDYQTGGAAAITPYICCPGLLIDDLGTEDTTVNYYGTTNNVIQHILMERYNDRNRLTHVTTNLSLGQVAELYKDRVYDRVSEMFNIVTMIGKSFRPGTN